MLHTGLCRFLYYKVVLLRVQLNQLLYGWRPVLQCLEIRLGVGVTESKDQSLVINLRTETEVMNQEHEASIAPTLPQRYPWYEQIFRPTLRSTCCSS